MSRRGGLAPMAALLLIGCAPLAPALTPPSSAGGAMPRSGAAPAAATAPGRATPDTVPSADAERVLATIPDPLTPRERAMSTPAADSSARPPAADTSGTARAAMRDSATAADTSGAAVPTPAPTAPLGERPGELARILSPDSATAAPAGPAAQGAPRDTAGAAHHAPSPAPAAADSAHGRPAPGGECFRLQVGAPADRAHAATLQLAAQSQLEVPFEIQRSRGLYKVRTRDCMTRDVVDRLRERAKAAGFRGIFVVPGAAK